MSNQFFQDSLYTICLKKKKQDDTMHVNEKKETERKTCLKKKKKTRMTIKRNRFGYPNLNKKKGGRNRMKSKAIKNRST